MTMPLTHWFDEHFGVMWQRAVTIDDPTLPVVVELELEVQGGRLVVSRLAAARRADGPPVTVDVLKSLPLVGLASRAATGGPMMGLVKRERTDGKSVRVSPLDLDRLTEAERAAVVYRAAFFIGMPPTAAVAEVLGISRDMAAKRVQAARLAGLLEPTSKGRKGA